MEVLEEPKVICHVLPSILEVVEGEFCLLEVVEVPGVICCVLRCVANALEGELL